MENKFTQETIFADRDNCIKVARYLKYNWVKNILYQTGMNLENCFPEDSDDPEDQTIKQKAQLKKSLKDNDIVIVDDFDDGVKIYIQDEVIAEWKKPTYDLRRNNAEIDPKNRNFVGVNIEHWSVFDEEDDDIEDNETNGE